MDIAIECVRRSDDDAACEVREQVFGREWCLTLPRLNEYNPDQQLTFIGRNSSDQEPVSVLTVVETTGDLTLHRRLGLSFGELQTVARYTQLAVLKPYRGMNLPVQMILEARRKFIIPRKIDQTWLLFDADRANSSALCNLLGFIASGPKFLTEYGWSRVLIRNEASRQAVLCDGRAESFLKERRRTDVVTAGHLISIAAESGACNERYR